MTGFSRAACDVPVILGTAGDIARVMTFRRRSGVPFFISTGMRLPATRTEPRLVVRHPPRRGFAALERRPEPSQLVVRPDPSTGVRIVMDARRGDLRRAAPVTFDVRFAEAGGEGATPHEVLLQAAIAGEGVRVGRQNGVEETRRNMQPLLDAPPPHTHRPNTWGPAAADDPVAGHGGWHEPWEDR